MLIGLALLPLFPPVIWFGLSWVADLLEQKGREDREASVLNFPTFPIFLFNA